MITRALGALRIALVAFAITALAGCGGDLVRLGDGPPGGGAPCAKGQVAAGEVLWIGDSWILLPGIQHRRVRDLARSAGALGETEDYENLAEAATTLSQIIGQYESRRAGATEVKVLLMDGGTWDTLNAGGAEETVTAVGSEFERFLADVANDGTVEHIVYFLQPELPAIQGVAALRPLVRSACEQSAVPCHFLDLQPLWGGHPEYTDASGIQASDAGGTVIADEIWRIMKENCIAQ